MSAQPEALRLADGLERDKWHVPAVVMQAAADELRRLHAENKRLSWDSIHTCHSECQRPLCKLTRERNALLEALLTLLSYANVLEMRLADADGEHRAMQQARAAIAKAVEGESNG